MSKAGFFTYTRERLEGFESRPNEKVALFQKQVSAFPEYHEVHPTVVWENFKAMREGADLASKQLWK